MLLTLNLRSTELNYTFYFLELVKQEQITSTVTASRYGGVAFSRPFSLLQVASK